VGVTNEGLNHVLDTQFHGSAAVATWYLGLINNASFSALAAADTLASHAGWLEATGYTGNRPAWTEGAASGQAVTNAATVDFAMTGTVTIYGLLLASVASGSSGVLFCTAAFSGGTQAVVNGDTLKCTLTISAASG
jgi:hypothetical protein